MKIPEEIYAEIFNLTTSLVNAREVGETKTCWALYNNLRTFCEKQSDAGFTHPFLWETLADFTGDDRIATDLYQMGLACAISPDAACYRASINLALAERAQRIGENRLAREHTARAGEEAKGLNDIDLLRDITEFTLGLRESIPRYETN